MVIHELLIGETIKVDNHHQNLPFDWNSKQDIHLHKQTKKRYNGKSISVDVKISLNTDRGINIVPPKRLSNQDQKKVREQMEQELRNAFENPRNLDNVQLFIKDILHFINNINNSNFTKECVKDAFNRIMRFFGVTQQSGELLVNEANNYFQKYEAHNGTIFYIASKSDSIELSEFDKERKQKYIKEGFPL